MTTRNQLPPYFQKYLDQRFAIIEIQLEEIKTMLGGMSADVNANTKWRQNVMAKLTVLATIGSFMLTLLLSYIERIFKRM